MKNQKVLLVEDAKDMQMIVDSAIGKNCDLTCVGSLGEAQRVLANENFSLVLLDVNLPDGDGFQFCENLRKDPKNVSLPIIFLTGQSATERKVFGFSLGADDYVTKPIDPVEFTARVMGRLKRQKQLQITLASGIVRADLHQLKGFIKTAAEERDLNLTPIELKLLAHFIRHEETILSREDLLVAVWGNSVHVSAHTLDTHISSLRKKMGDAGNCIRAIVKKGYCFSSSADEKTA